LRQLFILQYNFGMKTAISLPDEVFEAAEALAERLGMSRSQLYARAVEEYLAKHRDQDLTARLNDVYGEEESGLDPALRRAQGRTLRSNEW
jgi:metal-responsive CopG/Arc/MetJ family transcriptional regulator